MLFMKTLSAQTSAISLHREYFSRLQKQESTACWLRRQETLTVYPLQGYGSAVNLII